MLNAQQLEGHWTELSGRIKERWGAITDDDLTRAEGDVDQLVGIIQRKTGEARNRVEDFLEELSADYSDVAGRASAAAREYAAKARDTYDDVSRKMQDGYHDAEEMVRTHPVQSVAVAFGTGLIAGVIVGLVLRPR